MGLIDELKKKMEPTDALIFYSCSNDVYVEHRNIKDGRMGAGQPLDISQLAAMIKLVEKYAKEQAGNGNVGGAIPKNLLFASTDIENMRLVWWRKPQERKMYFSESLEIPNGTMTVPGMVYSVNGKKVSVWCFKGRCPKRVLYRAPFFNVYLDGKVCLGNSKAATPKCNTFEEWMLYWEKMFWQSEFDALIADNPIEGNLSSITKKCINSCGTFPTDVLKKSNVKLKDIIER